MVSSTFDTARVPDEPAEASSDPKTIAKALPHPWIVSPIFDSIFVTGGVVWALMILHVVLFGWNSVDPVNAVYQTGPVGSVNGSVSKFIVVFGLLGTYFFSDTHTAATYMRVYATKESREQFKFYANYLPWASLILLTLALTHPYIAGVVVYVHMMWVFQHYCSQSFGIGLIYCYKRGYMMAKFERDVFRWLMLGLSFFVITRILCFRDFSPYEFFGVQLPFWGLPTQLFEAARIFYIGVTCVFAFIVVRKFVVERKLMPIPCLMIILSVSSLGLSVGYANSMWWAYGAPFFHGSQYCAVALAFYLKERGMKEGADPRTIAKMFLSSNALRWYGLAFLAGIFIYVGVPSFLENFGLQFVMSATCIQACLNFHHFVTDAAIWKLRDPNARKILVS